MGMKGEVLEIVSCTALAEPVVLMASTPASPGAPGTSFWGSSKRQLNSLSDRPWDRADQMTPEMVATLPVGSYSDGAISVEESHAISPVQELAKGAPQPRGASDSGDDTAIPKTRQQTPEEPDADSLLYPFPPGYVPQSRGRPGWRIPRQRVTDTQEARPLQYPFPPGYVAQSRGPNYSYGGSANSRKRQRTPDRQAAGGRRKVKPHRHTPEKRTPGEERKLKAGQTSEAKGAPREESTPKGERSPEREQTHEVESAHGEEPALEEGRTPEGGRMPEEQRTCQERQIAHDEPEEEDKTKKGGGIIAGGIMMFKRWLYAPGRGKGGGALV